MSERTKLLIAQLAAIAAACGFFFFYGLGAFGLVGADEPRYAQIGREMLARHDWIVPTLNGQPWLEKPVLLYWREMVAYTLFGVHDWVARLPSATFATGLALAIFFFARRFRYGSEFDAALMAITSAGVIGFARGASTDMQLSAPFCVAMLVWWAWHETGKEVWLAMAYVLLAVGTLAKGPVAPGLALLIVAAYAWLRRDGSIFWRTIWIPGIAIFCAIALPWYIAVQVKVPSFFRTFFLEHNLERFSTNLYQHSQPFWYYIPVFLLAVVPWVAFTIPALVETIRNAVSELRSRDDLQTGEARETGVSQQDWLAAFLVLWILIPIIFFSISRSKLPGYILPSIPPAALLTAIYLHARGKLRWLQITVHSLVCAAVVGGALFAPWRIERQPLPIVTKNIILVGAGIVAIAVLLVLRRAGLRRLQLATIAPMAIALIFLLRPEVAAIVDQTQSARMVEVALEKSGAGKDAVAVFNAKRDVEYGLNFYRNQPISRYERDGIPASKHLVIAKEGNADAVRALVGDRQVTNIGSFAPQHLEFFRVAGTK